MAFFSSFNFLFFWLLGIFMPSFRFSGDVQPQHPPASLSIPIPPRDHLPHLLSLLIFTVPASPIPPPSIIPLNHKHILTAPLHQHRRLLRRRNAPSKAQGGRRQGKGQAQGFAAECGKGVEDRGILDTVGVCVVWCTEGRGYGLGGDRETDEEEGASGTECGGCGWWCEGTVVCRNRAAGGT